MFCRLFLSYVLFALIVSPNVRLQAVWSCLSPKAERAVKVLEGVDDEIEKSLRDYQVPGASVGIVVDGFVVYAKGFGFRDLEAKLPVTAETQFLIGSCTKAFTSFVMGCLVDEGVIGWDDRIADVLPEFRLSDRYASQMLTFRELLSHQTQLPRHDYYWYNSELTPADVFRRMKYLDLDTNSYERFHYNNLTYLALGMSMERLTNMSWKDLVTTKILTPLKMTKTVFSVDEMQKSGNYSHPYIEKDDVIKRMNFRNFTLVGPGACMISNISDMTRWVQLQINRGEWDQTPLISQATFKEMHAPQVIVGGYPESKEEQVRSYGLGWYVQSHLGILNVMHDGALDGFTSFVSLLPQKGIGIVVLSNKNLTAWPRMITMELFDRLLEIPRNGWLKEGLTSVTKSKEVMRETIADELITRKKGTTPSHSLEEYVGIYEHPAYGLVHVDYENGALIARYNNFKFQLEHWHYDVFSICKESEDVLFSFKNIKLTFRNGLNGDVNELIIPFECKAPDIVFRKKVDDSFTQTNYLRRFTGTYEIYSYIVEISLRNHTLYATIPGQPMYELIPNGKDEFLIKSMKGFFVRFVMNANDHVDEVLLLQPYGFVYTAKPRTG